MKLNILTTAIIGSGLAMFASSANAGVTTDHHGNVGYDTYDECVAAVQDGSAKFYTPYTYQTPKRMAGETSVKKMLLSEVTIPSAVAAKMPLKTQEYSAGACDRGVGQSNGRYGVSGKLVGKFVPFAADMPVNVYMDRSGTPVRLTMQQCDNHFGDKFPMPVISEAKAPKAQLAIQEERTVEPVVTETKRTYRLSTQATQVTQAAPAQAAQYRVKEVVIAPEDQITRVKTKEGTAVVVEGPNKTVYLGNEVDPRILNKTAVTQPVPVYKVPDVDQSIVVDPVLPVVIESEED